MLHFQNAYVTRDIDKAIALFKDRFGVTGFNAFDVTIDVKTPNGAGPMSTRMALAWKDNTQFEIIQPKGGLSQIYSDALPNDSIVKFHHICFKVDDWAKLRADVAATKRPMVLDGEGQGGLKFCYVDFRDTLGHYVEYTAMPDAIWTRIKGG